VQVADFISFSKIVTSFTVRILNFRPNWPTKAGVPEMSGSGFCNPNSAKKVRDGAIF